MKLSGFSILDRTLNGVTYSNFDTVNFIDRLVSAKDIVADIYFDYRLVCTSRVHFYSDMGHLIATLDGRFSLTTSEIIPRITIKVHQAGSDLVIMESDTEVAESVDLGDQDIDFYVRVISISPDLSTKCHIPESNIKPLGVCLLPPKVFEDLPLMPGAIVPEP